MPGVTLTRSVSCDSYFWSDPHPALKQMLRATYVKGPDPPEPLCFTCLKDVLLSVFVGGLLARWLASA